MSNTELFFSLAGLIVGLIVTATTVIILLIRSAISSAKAELETFMQMMMEYLRLEHLHTSPPDTPSAP